MSERKNLCVLVALHPVDPVLAERLGTDEARHAAERHAKRIERAVVTLGPRGSMVLEEGRVTPIAPHPADVVDTTGAGDAFTGTLLAALASGVELVPASRLASLVSAHSTTSVGAQASYASADQLRRLHA